MRISRLKIDGFGHFQQFELGLSPGLNLLHGPNEAGKSTLLAFIRAVLFGFERRNAPARYEPESGPFGGELTLEASFGPLWVRRVASKKRFDGELLLRVPGGEPAPDSRLADALGGISRELFYELFAFSLDELASFERLAAQGSVSEALFAAGMQGALKLPSALEGLRKSSEAVYTPLGKRKDLNQLLSELARVQDALRALGDRPSQYLELSAKMPRLAGKLGGVEAELSRLSERAELLGRLTSVASELARLEVVRAELRTLPALEDFPEGGTARLSQLAEAVSSARAARDEVMSQAASVERSLAELASGDASAVDAPKLKATVEAFQGRLQQFRALPQRKAILADRRRSAEAALSELGLPLSAEALLRMDLGAAARGRLTDLRDQLSAARERLRQQEAALSTARTAREGIEQQLRSLTQQVAALPAWPMETVRRRQTELERVRPLREELWRLKDGIRERSAALEAQTALASAEAPPVRLLPAFGVALVTLLLFGLAGGLYWLQGLPTALVGGGAALALSALLWTLQWRLSCVFRQESARYAERQAHFERERARLSGEREQLQRRWEETERALDRCLEAAGVKADADAHALATRADELLHQQREVEKRQRLSVESEQLTPRLVLARNQEQTAEVDRNVAEARASVLLRLLEELYKALEFPRGLSPEAALELWGEAAAVKQRLVELKAEEEGLSAEDRECLAAARAVLEAAEGAGLTPGSPEEALAGLSGLVERSREQAAQRRALLERRDDRVATLARCERACAEAEAALAKLLAQGHAQDEEDFRRKARQAEDLRRATREARELSLRIEGPSGRSVEDVSAQLAALGGAAGAAAELARLEEQLARLGEEQKAVSEERGGVKSQLRAWENDQELAALRAQEELLSARVTELAQRYVVDRLALALLTQARERHEKEQQPRVIQVASAFFQELTAGRYRRVFSSAQTRELVACDAHGKEWPAEALSRGTREALYLAFRLAVVQDFGETRLPLPLIVDDILVNFDPERQEATLELLRRLSARHQVIAFTCHPSLVSLFERRGAHIHPVAPRSARLSAVKAS